jgi:hypothetical protein
MYIFFGIGGLILFWIIWEARKIAKQLVKKHGKTK